MVEKEIALELARFLDSPRSRGAGAASARPVAEAFFRACYEDLGKRPHLLDGEDVALLMRELLPSRMGKGERLAEDVPAVLDGIVDHLEETGMLAQAFEVRSALAAGEGELARAVREGSLAHRRSAPPKPVAHRAPKLGRNDPCSCGSGKKYKKCHGKEA